MNRQSIRLTNSWLLGSLCVWLLCAWVSQQPIPAKKMVAKIPPIAGSVRNGTKQNPVSTHPAVSTVLSTDGVPVDPESGLALDKNLMLVKGQCMACHSSKLILQSYFDREKWVERIRWMQRTQKLWDLGRVGTSHTGVPGQVLRPDKNAVRWSSVATRYASLV